MPRARSKLSLTLLVLSGLIAANTAAAQSPALTAKASDVNTIVSQTQQKSFARVIVQFAAAPAAADLRPGNEASVQSLREYTRTMQDAVIAAHFANAADAVPGTGTPRALVRFDVTPGFAVNATQAEIDGLAADPRVIAIAPDRLSKPYLNQSVPLIGMDAAYANGATGSGYAVAVLDTGTQANHKFLAGKIVNSVCFSSSGGAAGVTLCPNGQPSQTGAGASEATTANCINTGNNTNLCTHGGHVAGIAAGFNTALLAGEPVNGVAKNASIADFQVFTRLEDNDSCDNSPPCVKSFSSDQIRALDYVLQNPVVGGSRIASVNMSLGGGFLTTGACDSDPLKPTIDQLRAIGIATVIASGNEGNVNGITPPGCISTAVTVGSTARDDTVSAFTDMSTMVKLLAPGGTGGGGHTCLNGSNNADIHSALNGLNPADNAGFVCYAGTSMAAPHVAGAIGALRTKCPAASVDSIVSALALSGVAVTDQRQGGMFIRPRIQVDRALELLSCDATTTLASAVLPTSRSVQLHHQATAFATVINTGASTGNGCTLSLGSTVPGNFAFQTTDPATNQPIGTPNAPATISAGASQSFVFAVQPYSVLAETTLPIVASCVNSAPAPSVVGLNTLTLSASPTAVPDIIAVAATVDSNGILSLSGPERNGAFSIATANIGATGSLTATVDTGAATLPVTLNLCQTDPATSACVSAIGPSVTLNIATGETPTFAIFAHASGAVPLDPARYRVFVRFRDGEDSTRGATSVAIATP